MNIQNTKLTFTTLPEQFRCEDMFVYLLECTQHDSLRHEDWEALKPYLTPNIMRVLVDMNKCFFMYPGCNDMFNELPEVMQKAAIEANPLMVQYITSPSEQLILTALRRNGHMIKDLEVPITDAMIETAIDSSPMALEHIADPSEALCQRAFAGDKDAILHIPNPSHEMLREALAEKPSLLYVLCNRHFDRVIKVDNIDLYEACMHDPFNHHNLGIVPESMSFKVDLSEPLNPGKRQVELFMRLMTSVAQVDQIEDLTLFRDFLIPMLKKMPLGKKYRDEWQQRDAAGVPLLEWLDRLRQVVSELHAKVTLVKTHDQQMQSFYSKAGQQIEWGLAGAVNGRREPVLHETARLEDSPL